MIEPADRALGAGQLANVDAVLHVRESRVDPSGMRAIDIAPANGITVRILPDRGFDLGQAWFAGVPLAWVSRVGEVAPIDDPSGMDWASAFGGGLLVTCGLRNVGLPSEGHGLHGTFSHLPAREVRVERVGDGDGYVRATATVLDPVEPAISVSREILAFAGYGRVEVTDRARNLGDRPAEAPLLYHLNFGYPLWSGHATFDADVRSTEPRDDASVSALTRWRTYVPPIEGPEWVLEHVPVATDGVARARIANVELATEVVVSWGTDELPVLNQWIDANPGMAVLGVEPANCTTRGLGHERAGGTVPVIEAGAERVTRIVVEARRL